MSRKPRTGPVLDYQLVHLGGLVALLLIGAAWLAVIAQGQLLWPDTLRGDVRALDRHLFEASAGANDYVVSVEDGDWARFQHAILSLREGVERVGATDRDLAATSGASVEAVGAAIAAAEAIHDAAALDDRVAAMRVFDEKVAVVADLLESLDEEAARTLARRQFRRLAAAGGLMAVLALYAGVTGLGARRRWARATTLRADEARSTLARNVVALQRAREGRELPPASDSEFVAPLEAEVDAVAALLDELRAVAEEDARWSDFGRDLEAALDLADSEAEVYEVARRAGAIAFPGQAIQLWLSDHSFSELLPRCDGGEALCRPEGPGSCPAVRRSDIESHAAGESLARCPRLVSTDTEATCAFVPIGGRSQGALQIGEAELDERHLAVLRQVASAVGARLSAVRALGKSELQARTDVLTGLANRRAMNHRLAELDRQQAPYAVISADLDHFKQLNDTFGHEVGDRCLKVFAQVMRDAVRDTDLACRPGGEEFAVILPGIGLDAAVARAEQIRARIQEASRSMGTGFTASLGVAMAPEHGDDADAVLRAADQALYAAKEGGRNRVQVFRLPPSLEAAS